MIINMIIGKCGEKPHAPAIAKHWYKNTKAKQSFIIVLAKVSLLRL